MHVSNQWHRVRMAYIYVTCVALKHSCLGSGVKAYLVGYQNVDNSNEKLHVIVSLQSQFLICTAMHEFLIQNIHGQRVLTLPGFNT